MPARIWWHSIRGKNLLLLAVYYFERLILLNLAGVKKAETWSHAWGIMGDDMVAALITQRCIAIAL